VWVFLNNAFVSAVQHRDNADLLVVRARVEGDLERFFAEDQNLKVERTEDADYLFRTTIRKNLFAAALLNRMTEIDYANFKDSIALEDADRHGAYLRVWQAMNNLQGLLYGVGAYVKKFVNLG
jgi:hypothetical protein